MSVRRADLGLLALGAMAWAQQPAVMRIQTRTALVEAVVTGKKGEYVHDLTAKDFHIWQDGKEQAITSLSLESKSIEPHFLVLFFDGAGMAAQDQFRARQAVSRFIDANVAPGHLMAVVGYDGSLRVTQNFTDNAARLKDALNRMEMGSPTTPTKPTAADNFASRNMLQAVGNLAKGLGVLPGRKTVVLLSGVIPSSSDQKSQVAMAVEASSKAGVAIYPVNVRPVSVDLDPSPANPPTRAGRGGRGLQGTDDSPRTQDLGTSQDLLLALANGTGGFLIRDSSDLLAGLQQIGEEQSEYYVLSYTPPDSKEGSCHALRVKVDRGGATVRARSSYCATKPQDLIAGTPAAKDLESRVANQDGGNLAASIQLPYFYISPGVARVHLAMEIAPGALKFESQRGQNQQGKLHAEVNLLGIATAPDGSIGARFSDAIKLDFENQSEIEKLKGTSVHYEKEFKIAPGKYNFALAFGSGGEIGEPGDSFGKIETPLDVEPWNAGELALSSLALSRETHPAADLGLVSSLVEDRTPLIAEGVQFVPFGSNQFAKSDMGFFYLEIYDPDPASVGVRVRVLDRKTEEPKWDSGVTKIPLSSNGIKAGIPAGASLRISSLARGSYELEITASDSAGKQVKRTADFEVK
jgi:VWFA-related protein